MTDHRITPISRELGAKALKVSLEGDRYVDNAAKLFQKSDYLSAIVTLTEYLDESSSFFDQDLPVNPMIRVAGHAFVRAHLLRITVMFEWCRVEATVRDQLMPEIRDDLRAMSEWPEEFFEKEEMAFFQDMRRRFHL